jgi:hypothetical protein
MEMRMTNKTTEGLRDAVAFAKGDKSKAASALHVLQRFSYLARSSGTDPAGLATLPGGRERCLAMAKAESINADVVGADRMAFERMGAAYLRFR